MRKSVKIAAFVGTVCATTALVATAAQGTGAWFTDSTNGNITAASGHLTITPDQAGNANLSFTDLMPGTDQTKTIGYTVKADSGAVDLWMVFTPTAASGYFGLTGNAGDTPSGLGRFGHFAVGASSTALTASNYNDAIAFQSYNLQDTTQNDYINTCAAGNGFNAGTGNANQTDTSLTSNSECGVPEFVRLATDLPNNYHGYVDVTFGLTGKQQTQGQQNDPNVNFKLVAIQAGHSPADAYTAPYTTTGH